MVWIRIQLAPASGPIKTKASPLREARNPDSRAKLMPRRHNPRRFRIRVFILGFVLTYVAISWLVALAEGWGMFDGLYYGMAVMTTVGFGDFVPVTVPGKILTLVLSPVAIILGFGIGILMLQDSFKSLVHKKSFGMVPKNLHDHYIVIGYGRTGRAVTETLLTLGHPVCVLEADEAVRNELERRGIHHVIGSALDQENIDRAKVLNCAGVVITFENDAESVYVVLEVRERRTNVPIIVTASSRDSARRLKLAGASRTILSRAVAGDMLAKAALNPEALDLVTVGSSADQEEDHAAFAQVAIEEDSWLAGQPLRELGVKAPGALVVMAVHGDDRRLAPSGELVVEAGMMLVLVGDPEAIQAYESTSPPKRELTERLMRRREGAE